MLEAEDSPQITNEDVLTVGLMSEYGSLPLWELMTINLNKMPRYC